LSATEQTTDAPDHQLATYQFDKFSVQWEHRRFANNNTDKGENLFIDKFGLQTTDPSKFDPTFNAGAPHPLYFLNDQTNKVDSTPARLTGGFIDRNDVGFDFGSTDGNKVTIGETEASTTNSGTWNDGVATVAGKKFEITFNTTVSPATTSSNKLVTLFTSTATDLTLTAAEVDAALALQKATLRTTAGIEFAGSAVEGTLTFFSTDGGPFTMLINNQLDSVRGGFNGADFSASSAVSIGSSVEPEKGLSNESLLRISVDDSDPVDISLPDSLRGKSLSGTELAAELTKAINSRFGDDQNIAVAGSGTDAEVSDFTLFATFVDNTATLGSVFVDDPLNSFAVGTTVKNALIGGIRLRLPANSNYRPAAVNETNDLVNAIQTQVDTAIGAGVLKVGYDPRARTLTFKPRDNAFKIASLGVTGPITSGVESANDGLGFPAKLALVPVGAGATQGAYRGSEILPNGDEIQNEDQRRYGIKVEYLKDQRKFVFSSGTTGERSLITVSVGDNLRAADLLGISDTYTAEIVKSVGSGLESKAAVTTGSKAGIDVSGTFSVTANDNTVNVTIDGIDGSFRVPAGAYTGATFASALEVRINAIAASTGRSVGGVTVNFDANNSRFVFTSGTTLEESFINVNGHPNFGLAATSQERGSVPKVTVLVQAKDADGNLLYIDKDGKETTKKPENLPNYAPIYLTKGQLTFDTAGKLISPKEGARYTPFDPQNGADLIVLNVDYGKFSTQFSQPFSVLSLTQDGFTSGRLDGISIDSAGTVRANYTNGEQQALGKLILANFASPNGLKQIGNANYVSTSNSGEAVVGVAGADGYGSIQGGSLERANVDLTEELVNLITAQRNFQANAKAIETATNLTSTIVNLRG
jgi:flagellar hook-basal body protein